MFGFLDFTAGEVRHRHKTSQTIPGLEVAERITIAFLSRSDTRDKAAEHTEVRVFPNGRVTVTRQGIHRCCDENKICDCGAAVPITIEVGGSAPPLG